MSAERMVRQLRRVMAAAALVTLTGCASYAAVNDSNLAYYDPGYGYGGGLVGGDGVLAFDGNGRARYDGGYRRYDGRQDHIGVYDHVGVAHGGFAGIHGAYRDGSGDFHAGFGVARAGGIHVGFGAGHGRG